MRHCISPFFNQLPSHHKVLLYQMSNMRLFDLFYSQHIVSLPNSSWWQLSTCLDLSHHSKPPFLWSKCVQTESFLFHSRNTWRKSSIIFFLIWITVTHSVPPCSFWKVFLPRLTTPPKRCSSAWRRNDLCCSYLSFRIDFLRILLSWLSWLCPVAISQSPAQAQVQFLHCTSLHWPLLVDRKE